jgi:hypothetical protein
VIEEPRRVIEEPARREIVVRDDEIVTPRHAGVLGLS